MPESVQPIGAQSSRRRYRSVVRIIVLKFRVVVLLFRARVLLVRDLVLLISVRVLPGGNLVLRIRGRTLCFGKVEAILGFSYSLGPTSSDLSVQHAFGYPLN